MRDRAVQQKENERERERKKENHSSPVQGVSDKPDNLLFQLLDSVRALGQRRVSYDIESLH